MEATNGIRGDARAEWLTNNRDAAKILDGYTIQAERAFIQRIEQAGLKLTGELLNSFREIAAKEAGVFVESRLEMAGQAKATVVSMENSPIKMNYEKDKSSEGGTADQELATHLSDTVDYYIIRRMKTGVARATEDFEIEFW